MLALADTMSSPKGFTETILLNWEFLFRVRSAIRVVDSRPAYTPTYTPRYLCRPSRPTYTPS